MPCKVSLLMTISTAPVAGSGSSVHVAGWSESMWSNKDSETKAAIDFMAVRRARILPSTGKIVGYRQQTYVLADNKVIPGGSSAGALNFPGNSSWDTDLPQVALLCTAGSDVAGNSRRFTLRGIPDVQMQGGEFAPSAAFLRNLETYLDALKTESWKYLGRNLTDTSVAVVSVLAGKVTTSLPIPNVAQGNYVRLLKIKGADGKPIQGSYRVSAIAGNEYTLENLDPAKTAKNSGRIRRDRLALITMTSTSIGRAVIRKVGRPFDGYRGRR